MSETIGSPNFPLNAPISLAQGLSGPTTCSSNGRGTRLDLSAASRSPEETFIGVSDSGLGPPVQVGEVDYRCQRLILREPHQNAGGVLYIFYPESLLEEAIADAERPSLFGLVFGLVALILTFGIGQRLVGRIRTLERRTRQIAGGDFSPAPLPRADDELRDLTASVNEMAARLDRLQQAVQRTERLRLSGQLAAGLAHQLRNGITGALALQVHLADHPGDGEVLTVACGNCRSWRRTCGGSSTCRPGPEASRFLSGISDRRRSLSRGAARGDRTSGSRPRTDAERRPPVSSPTCRHLIGNAIGLGRPTVTVTLSASDSAPLSRWDTGPGPPADVAGRLFEPFRRKPKGSGWGWRSARGRAHGGRLDWRRDAADGVPSGAISVQ